jgi:hypothetical protein
MKKRTRENKAKAISTNDALTSTEFLEEPTNLGALSAGHLKALQGSNGGRTISTRRVAEDRQAKISTMVEKAGSSLAYDNVAEPFSNFQSRLTIEVKRCPEGNIQVLDEESPNISGEPPFDLTNLPYKRPRREFNVPHDSVTDIDLQNIGPSASVDQHTKDSLGVRTRLAI